MKPTGSILAIASLVSLAHGHGFVTSPKARMPGSAMKASCGEQVENNQKSDNYGNVQGELQVAKGQSDFNSEKCEIFLCKGYKFADNKDNVQSYSAGQTVPFKVDIRAPHTGVANVSVVDTASNSVIGSPLKSWENYASTATGVQDDEENFSVTIPDNLGSKCSEAGACVLQWYWYAQSIDQTYESCVDFTVGGSGSGSGSDSGSGSSSSTSAASEVEVTSSPNTGSNVVSSAPVAAATPTTLATSVKPAPTGSVPSVPSGVPSSSAAAAVSAIPTGASADEQLNWVGGLFKALMKYAH